MACACNGSQPTSEPRTYEAVAPNGEVFSGLTQYEAKVKATMIGGTWRPS